MRDAQRTILIGDVHGCIDELERLLKQCGYAPGDRLISVGDLVAKGPDSQAVVQCVRELNAWTVRGNHDEGVLRCVRAERAGKRDEKLKKSHQKVASSLRAEDVDYLEHTPFYLQLPELFAWVVHAGVMPSLPLEAQDPVHLMTMRTIRPDGSASARLDEGVLWATRFDGPSHVVFGHDAISGLQQHPFATGLDTGCVYGRALTALILPEKKLISVDAKRAYQELSA